MSGDTEEVWVTKYALTTGVYKVSGSPWDSDPKRFNPLNRSGLIHLGDWHRTAKAASARVAAMIVARRNAMLKEVQKLLKIENALVHGDLPMAKERP